ncbi:MAG: hypothetical protein V4736_15845 [Bdellovibrionota bacterium]
MQKFLILILTCFIASPALALSLNCQLSEGENSAALASTASKTARVTQDKNKRTGIELIGENHSCLVEASGSLFDMTVIDLETLPDGSKTDGTEMTNTSGKILTAQANFLTVTDESGTVQCLCSAK